MLDECLKQEYSGTWLIRTPRGHALVSILSGVRIKRALKEKIRDTCFSDIKTNADSFMRKHYLTSHTPLGAMSSQPPQA